MSEQTNDAPPESIASPSPLAPPNPFASLTPVDQEHLNELGAAANQAERQWQQAMAAVSATKEQKDGTMGAFEGAAALVIKQRGCNPKDFRCVFDAATGQVQILERAP